MSSAMNQRISKAPGRKALSDIDTWLFDLDNTLYSSGAAVFPQIHRRMLEFIMAEQKIGEDEAKAERSRYFHQHGTTMRGMMVERGVDPVAFMDHVHAIDLGCLDPAPRLGAAIARLPGRKLIFTNASARHASNVLGALGIAEHFEALFDVGDCDWLPKPDATGYRNIVAKHAFDPKRAAMIDDIPNNLRPAAALGMTTVWVREPADPRWKGEPDTHAHVDYVTDDLVTWLEAIGAG
jgi:putative hydrolase of the HAD superfamily